MDIFLPVHDALHELLGQKMCGWPGLFGLCPEFWLGFGMAWVAIKLKPQLKLIDIIKNLIKKSKKEKEDKKEL
jgi:hypothetical protein